MLVMWLSLGLASGEEPPRDAEDADADRLAGGPRKPQVDQENIFVKDIEKLTKQVITKVKDHPYPQTDRPMTNQEKKEFNKEKQKRKRSYFRPDCVRTAAGIVH